MKVEELLSIRDSKINNREKAMLIARSTKASAKKNNPMDAETPTGWNSSPYAGQSNPHET